MYRPATGKGHFVTLRLAESEERQMTSITKLRNWLITFPRWTGNFQVQADYTDGVPTSYGLYPLGAEEISRREDVLGNVTVRCRYRFHLYRVSPLADRSANANWLLEFQQWVRQQSATGAAPQFGDEPKEEIIRAEKGKLNEISQSGTGTYVVTLTVEFVKKY